VTRAAMNMVVILLDTQTVRNNYNTCKPNACKYTLHNSRIPRTTLVQR
jgi:hypothetical protein